MRFTTSAVLLSASSLSYATKHNLYVGSYSTPDIFALQFDTEAQVLKQTARYPAHAGHASLAFNYDKKTLYGAEQDGWSSYTVDKAGRVRFQSNMTLNATPCPGETNSAHGRTMLLAQMRAPYNVFASAQRSCGNVITTKPDGSLKDMLQTINYGPNSRILGMATDSNDDYVYSADMKGNGIWVSKADPSNGALTPIAFTSFPVEDARPRRLALHASSRYLYVLLSRTMTVGVYEVDGSDLKFTGINYSVIPKGANPDNYIGQDILLSADGNILYTSARFVPTRPQQTTATSAQISIDKEDEDVTDPFNWWAEGREEEDEDEDDDDEKKRLAKVHKAGLKPVRRQTAENEDDSVNPATVVRASARSPGYITAIRLTDGTANSPVYGPGAAGFPLEVILQVPTATGGGRSNTLSPAPWGNEYFALTDSELGMVQIWKVEGLDAYVRTRATVPAASEQYLGDILKTKTKLQKRQTASNDSAPLPDMFVNEQGQYVNEQGQLLNPDGSIIPDQTPPPVQTPYDPTIPAGQPQQQVSAPQPSGQQQQPYDPNFGNYQPPYDPNAVPAGSSYQNPYANQPVNPQPAYVPPVPQTQPQPQPQQPTVNNPYSNSNPYSSIPISIPGGLVPGWGGGLSSIPVFNPYQQTYPQNSNNGNGGGRPRPDRTPPRPVTPAAPVVVPVAAAPGQAGLLTGLLGGVLGGKSTDVTGGLLGTNGGRGLLGGGGLLGLGILKKRSPAKHAKPAPPRPQQRLGGLAPLSVSVVAQWNAPHDAVGAADLESVVDKVYDRRPVPSLRTAAHARRQSARFDPSSRNSFNVDLAIGGGCCSSAVWLD